MGGGTGGGGGEGPAHAIYLALNITPIAVAWKESTLNGPRPPPPQLSSSGADIQERRNVTKSEGAVKLPPHLEQKLISLRYRFMQMCALLVMLNHSPYKSLYLETREIF